MKAFAPIFLALVCIFPVIALIPKKSPPSGRKMQRVIRNFKNSPEGDTSGDFILNHGNKVFRGERSKTGDKDVLEPDKINRHATRHKKWGVERGCPAEYWFDSRIHTLGNIGIGGAFHAATAPIATKIIDDVAYNGIDIRQQVANELSKTLKKGKARVADLCCGVGISTRALQNAFPEAESVVGIDASPQMISMARFLTGHLVMVKPAVEWMVRAIKKQGIKVNNAATQCALKSTTFLKANAEDTKLPDESFDLVTVMYAFHEAPRLGRERIIREAGRLLQKGGVLAIIDISTDYEPSESMLKGEPYVLEYQKNIHRQLSNVKGFRRSSYKTLVPGHVGMWLLRRTSGVLA